MEGTPEVDRAGYDLIAECSGHVRHIQLKGSYRGSRTAVQKVHLLSGGKAIGLRCVGIFRSEFPRTRAVSLFRRGTWEETAGYRFLQDREALQGKRARRQGRKAQPPCHQQGPIHGHRFDRGPLASPLRRYLTRRPEATERVYAPDRARRSRSRKGQRRPRLHRRGVPSGDPSPWRRPTRHVPPHRPRGRAGKRRQRS